MTRLTFDQWEDQFIALCEEILDEEPLYPYQHLWKRKLSVKQAFQEYLQENPDYAEMVTEKSEFSAPNTPDPDKQKSDSQSSTDHEQSIDLQKIAADLEASKRKAEAEQRLSRFCPECARVMKKNVCACGYKKPGNKKPKSLW